MMSQDLRIEAEPTKTFFIEMLTRDIRLVDSIMDLVDNSVHGYILLSGVDVTEGLMEAKLTRSARKTEIAIDVDRHSFRIKDTCGGISVEDARKHVFRFGTTAPGGDLTGLSVYGIGMKRAFFKMGRTIVVASQTRDERFEMEIDVEKWKKEKNWEFSFTKIERRRLPQGEEAGTTITISGLNDGVGEAFGQTPFLNELKRKLASAYSLFLRVGVRISVNGDQLHAELPEIARSSQVTPVRKTLVHGDVEILLLAGLAKREERPPRGGWYVFCNGRMVLEADKTTSTGWGETFPAFHSKYNAFVGYVYFRSPNVNSLPWTTTKSGVVQESPVYQFALAEMKVQARPVLNFLNKLYPGDVPFEGLAERDLLEKTQVVAIDKIAPKDTVFVVVPLKRRKRDVVTIQYKRPVKQVNRIRLAIGRPNMSAYRVGEFTFDWYLNNKCD